MVALAASSPGGNPLKTGYVRTAADANIPASRSPTAASSTGTASRLCSTGTSSNANRTTASVPTANRSRYGGATTAAIVTTCQVLTPS